MARSIAALLVEAPKEPSIADETYTPWRTPKYASSHDKIRTTSRRRSVVASTKDGVDRKIRAPTSEEEAVHKRSTVLG